jgi:hypothetical protein
LLTKKTVNVAELKFLNINLLENLWQDWKWLSSHDQQPIWQSLKNFENNNRQMLYSPGVESS